MKLKINIKSPNQKGQDTKNELEGKKEGILDEVQNIKSEDIKFI